MIILYDVGDDKVASKCANQVCIHMYNIYIYIYNIYVYIYIYMIYILKDVRGGERERAKIRHLHMYAY